MSVKIEDRRMNAEKDGCGEAGVERRGMRRGQRSD
jgi:hypothetical protein